MSDAMRRPVMPAVDDPTGIVFDVQGFSVSDGSGCRTLVFLKGCTQRCVWCANPEGREEYPLPLFEPTRCLYGAECVRDCPEDAITLTGRDLAIDRTKCVLCTSYACAAVCKPEALRIAGRAMRVSEVLAKLQRDRQYWGADGGVTLTGGEPFYQHVFATRLLERCKAASIATCVETCGNVPWATYERALPFLDWMFLDIKHIDPEKNRAGTGHDNALILANAAQLAEKFQGRLIFRTVVIPGYNDDDDAHQRLASFLASLPLRKREVNLLPLHHLAKHKYEQLGLEYFSKSLERPSDATMKRLQSLYEAAGFACYLGSNTPF